MSDIVSPLLEWLNAHPNLAGLVTFMISAGESVAIIGTIVPGTIMMTALGALAGAGVIPFWATIVWAIFGAIIGDGISYWIGYHFKDRLHRFWPFRSYPMLLKTGEKFFHRHGGMSVFIGRFVGPVRALVPMVAGMLGMKPLRFIFANVTSAIGWAPAYMLPGLMLGAASLELPPDIAIHVILVLVLISLFTMLCLWFAYKLLQLINSQINQAQDWIWHRLKKSRTLYPLTYILKHHDKYKTHGQLNLAIYLGIVGFLFFSLAIYVKAAGPENITINEIAFHFFRGIRNINTDNIMIAITLLGQKQVILPVIAIFFAWLIYKQHKRIAFHTLALGMLAAGSVFVIKNLIQSPRPLGILHSPETYSMPSGHATLATTVFMGLAFLIGTSIRQGHRWMVYTICILIPLAVGISRLYLGAHWFTDVLASWLLSAGVLLLVIISYERRAEKRVHPLGIFLVSLFALCVTTSVYYYKHIDQMKIDYTPVYAPAEMMEMQQWWEVNDQLSTYRSSLFGLPSQQINIEWAGSLDQIRQTLVKEGWSKPPARDWISTIHRIADISSTQYLPLISPQYLDKKPAIVLTRDMNEQDGLLFIRLWDANRVIKETNTTVWVGIVGMVPRSYSWLYMSKPGLIEIEPEYVFPSKTGTASWQWKLMPIPRISKTKHLAEQKIMLIRQNNSLHKKK